MKPSGPLREGFTTGTAAAGAAKAAARLLLTGQTTRTVDTPLPGGQRLSLGVSACGRAEGEAWATVVKDGGDDPDVTHGARIVCRVRHAADAAPGSVSVTGGHGVGRVTLPGLSVPVGEPAINPAPLRQIRAAVAEAAQEAGHDAGLAVVVEVPDGEALAGETMNPRLGIVGGISILGVSGIVRPFSHAAWKASIVLALDVAKSLGHPTIGLVTGRRSEALLAARFPDLPETALVEVADYFAFSLVQAARRGFPRIMQAAFVGKLTKMAQGLANTHAHRASTDFAVLAARCRQAGWPERLVAEAARATTARHVFALAPDAASRAALAAILGREALAVMRRFAGPAPDLSLVVFDFDGSVLLRL